MREKFIFFAFFLLKIIVCQKKVVILQPISVQALPKMVFGVKILDGNRGLIKHNKTMKKVFFVLAAAACMVACGNKAAESEAAAEDSVVVAEEVVEGVEAADSVVEEVADTVAAEVVAE